MKRCSFGDTASTSAAAQPMLVGSPRAQEVGAGVAARELGLVEQTLRNWVKSAAAGKLTAPGARPVTPEQMDLSRLRAENARLKMHVDI